MPVPIGAFSTYIPPLIPSASTPPSGTGRGRVFKAVKGAVKRIWQHGAGTKASQPFNLVRGDNEAKARARLAERVGQRMSRTADHMRAALRHAPDAKAVWRDTQGDMDKLQRDAQRLSALTRTGDGVDAVLGKQTLRRYLPEADDRQVERRRKTLFKLRTGPLSVLRSADPTLQKTWEGLERETALEASLPQVRNLCLAYAQEGDVPTFPQELMRDLVKLSTSMKMLRRHDLDPADFLYPAVKLMHERGRNANGAANDRPLIHLLRDLSANGAGNPAGLRENLSKHCAGPKFWLDQTFHLKEAAKAGSPSNRQSVAETNLSPARVSQAMMVEMDRLLDGLAGAARRVLKEGLMEQAPRWARDARPALFEESRILYTSARVWSESVPGLKHDAPLLLAAPEKAVGMLVEEAANLVLETPARPTDNRGPLLGALTAQLSSVVSRVDQTLEKWRISEHTSPDEIAAMRREMLTEVVAETGIWQEIHRLGRQTARQRVDLGQGPARAGRSATAGVPVSDIFKLRNPPPDVMRLRKRVAGDVQRQINSFLTVCRKADKKGSNTISSDQLAGLLQTRQKFTAVYGAEATETWRGLNDQVTERDPDLKLLSHDQNLLRTHIEGKLDLLAGVASPADRTGANEILHDIWRSMKTTQIRRETAPALKTWCATLIEPPMMADDAALFRQVDALRGSIGLITSEDNTVKADTLLEATVGELTDTELGALIGALAAIPENDAIPTVRQRVSSHLAGYYERMTDLEGGRGKSDNKYDHLERDKRITHEFLDRLYTVGRAQVEKRLDALEASLMPAFRAQVFAETGRLHTLLDTPRARETNGPLDQELRHLILDAVKNAEIRHEGNETASGARTSVRFLRTAQGYDLASAMSRALSLDIGELHKRLDAGMATLNLDSIEFHKQLDTDMATLHMGIAEPRERPDTDVGMLNRARFRSATAVMNSRNRAVERILLKTGIVEHLDTRVKLTLPRDRSRISDSQQFSDMVLRTEDSRPNSWTPSQFQVYVPATATPASPSSPTIIDADGYMSIEDLAPLASSMEHVGPLRPSATAESAELVDGGPIPLMRLDSAIYHNAILDSDPIYDAAPRGGTTDRASMDDGDSGIDAASLSSFESGAYETPRAQPSPSTITPATQPPRTSRNTDMASGAAADMASALDTVVRGYKMRQPILV